MMNSLGLKIPFAYAEKAAQMNWHDILLAIDTGYFCSEAAIEYARSMVGNDNAHESELVDLLCLSSSEIMNETLLHEQVVRLASEVSANEKKQTEEKLLYLSLKWLYDNRTNCDDPLIDAAVIFGDFDYPRAIEHLVYFMPAKNPSRVGRDVIFEDWQAYLENEGLRFAPEPFKKPHTYQEVS